MKWYNYLRNIGSAQESYTLFNKRERVTINSKCRYPADRVLLHTSFKSRQVAERASTCCHVPYDSGPRDDIAVSQPEARGGYHSPAVSPSSSFSPVGLLPQMILL
jgi:hypothetical protein